MEGPKDASKEGKDKDVVTVKIENKDLRGRYYRREFPAVDAVVMTKIMNVTDLGATCCLLEYNDIEGFIASSDYSRKRIRSVKKLMRVGKQEVLQVLRVDDTKASYVDLSKKLLTPKDIELCSERFEKAKTVNGILRRLAETRGTPLQQLYETFGWALYEGEDGHAYDVLQAALLDKAILDKYKVPKDVQDELMSIVRHRMSSTPIKVEAEINLTCFGIDGVDALKAALLEARLEGTAETPVSVVVKASPVYTLTVTHLDKTVGIEMLNKAIDRVKTKISTFSGGALEIKTAPHAVTV